MIVLHPTFHPTFVQFLTHFNDTHDYFECHEVLEDYWKEIAPNDKTIHLLHSSYYLHLCIIGVEAILVERLKQ